MSAFVVDPEHINVLLWAVHQRYRRPLGNLTWIFDNPIRVHQLTCDTLDQVGQMLVDTNTASVNYRYPDHQAEAYQYRYARPLHTTWSIVEVLNALRCYEYQACEPKDWEITEAYAFCREMQNTLIEALPEYDRGPWAITGLSQPVRRRPT